MTLGDFLLTTVSRPALASIPSVPGAHAIDITAET
jgi:hypothetical protein